MSEKQWKTVGGPEIVKHSQTVVNCPGYQVLGRRSLSEKDSPPKPSPSAPKRPESATRKQTTKKNSPLGANDNEYVDVNFQAAKPKSPVTNIVTQSNMPTVAEKPRDGRTVIVNKSKRSSRRGQKHRRDTKRGRSDSLELESEETEGSQKTGGCGCCPRSRRMLIAVAVLASFIMFAVGVCVGLAVYYFAIAGVSTCPTTESPAGTTTTV